MIRRLSVLISSVGLGLALVLAPTASSADETTPNPIKEVVNKVHDLVKSKTVQTAVDAQDPPASDDDIPSHETTNPVGPDHGSTSGTDAALLGSALLGLNHDNATINDDDTSTADSSLLSIGGTKVIGTHADSTGTNDDVFNILAPLCVGTGGALCVDALYSESHASNDGTTSSSTARSGILNACLLGTDTDQTNTCDGPVGLGIAQSEAHADRNLATGQTTADASYGTLGACVIPTGESCTVGALAIGSAGSADSGGLTPSADRGSILLGLALGGSPQTPIITDPTDLSLPSGCPAISLECLFLNQGESYLGPGLLAGTAQDALVLSVLKILPGGGSLADVGVGHTETLVHNDGRVADDSDTTDADTTDADTTDADTTDADTDADSDDSDSDADHDSDSDSDGSDNHGLPDTGGPAAGLLALGMLGIAIGSGTIALGRRRRLS